MIQQRFELREWSWAESLIIGAVFVLLAAAALATRNIFQAGAVGLQAQPVASSSAADSSHTPPTGHLPPLRSESLHPAESSGTWGGDDTRGAESSEHVPCTGNYQKYIQPACEWPDCGCTESREVHHIIPKDALIGLGLGELYTDPRNLITLCDCPKHACHLILGHEGSFQRWNIYLMDMVNEINKRRAVK